MNSAPTNSSSQDSASVTADADNVSTQHSSGSVSEKDTVCKNQSNQAKELITAVDSEFKTTGVYKPGYISKHGLEQLSVYKYKSGLSGYLDKNIMNPFWETCATYLPTWLA